MSIRRRSFADLLIAKALLFRSSHRQSISFQLFSSLTLCLQIRIFASPSQFMPALFFASLCLFVSALVRSSQFRSKIATLTSGLTLCLYILPFLVTSFRDSIYRSCSCRNLAMRSYSTSSIGMYLFSVSSQISVVKVPLPELRH